MGIQINNVNVMAANILPHFNKISQIYKKEMYDTEMYDRNLQLTLYNDTEMYNRNLQLTLYN